MHEYHLSSSEYKILAILTSIPTVTVWFIAFFGYSALAGYAEKVGTSREGKSYAAIARGLKWLSWGLPFSATVNTILGGVFNTGGGLQSTALILSHYSYLIVSIVAFTYMSDGSRGLRDIIDRLPTKAAIRVMIALAIIVSVTYCSVTLNAVASQHPNSYRLPLWLILFTIIVPYLYAWLMGFFAVFEISQYRRIVRGLIYKQALRLLATGTSFAIVASVALQFLSSTSRYFRRITLNWTLLFSYLILIIFAVGFIFIIVGANKLKKIEEV